jgi:phosphatidylinositol 4-kinase
VNFAERFKHPVIGREVSALVRSRPREVLHIPEAVEFLVGDKFDGRRDIRVSYLAQKFESANGHEQYLLFWDPVPPIIATAYFEPRYHSDPIILQYAHRALAQHPVEVTFFFVPQIVQALRYDELGGSPHARPTDTPNINPICRICQPFHIRYGQDFPVILPPNHLEYEGQLLQG